MKTMVLKRNGLLMDGKLHRFYFMKYPERFIVHVPEINMSLMCTVEYDTIVCKATPSHGPISVSEGSRMQFSKYVRDLAKDISDVGPHRSFVYCLHGMDNMGRLQVR